MERRQTEQALRQSEGKFRALFDFAKDAVFILDPEGRILEVNHEACERLGYSRDDLLKMNLLDVDTPEQALLISERIETLRRDDLFAVLERLKGKKPAEILASIKAAKAPMAPTNQAVFHAAPARNISTIIPAMAMMRPGRPKRDSKYQKLRACTPARSGNQFAFVSPG